MELCICTCSVTFLQLWIKILHFLKISTLVGKILIFEFIGAYHGEVHFHHWRLAVHWEKISVDAQLDWRTRFFMILFFFSLQLWMSTIFIWCNWLNENFQRFRLVQPLKVNILHEIGTGCPYFCFCETRWKHHKSFRFFLPVRMVSRYRANRQPRW